MAPDSKPATRRLRPRVPALKVETKIGAEGAGGRARGARLLACLVAALLAALAATVAAYGSTVSSASFIGGADTVTVNGVVYAKSGGALTLTVATSDDTKCVQITGAHTARQTSSTAKASWTFSFTAGNGDGVQSITAAASPNFNASNCTGQSQSPRSASYILDNTGPVVTGTVAPAPNAAGWNNQSSGVSITWSATDAGSGVATGPTPTSASQSGNTDGATFSSSATDRLGISGTGSVVVKLDKVNPQIQSDANTAPWYRTDVLVNFVCTDPSPSDNATAHGSGIKSCTGPQTVSTNGGTATGTAFDNADNSKTITVGPFKIDKIAPSLSGSPVQSPNAAGWYKSNVTIHWTCSDTGGSGIAGACPSDDTISGEGTGLTATQTVADVAGNSTTATSSPAVRIDRTPPTTGISGTSNDWTNGDVTVVLAAGDNLSGVASTTFSVDGGPAQTGTSFTLSAEGDHAISFFSTDRAGNQEAARTAHVKIDKTAPTIAHAFTPLSYTDGAWTNADVTVTFTCADQGSGVATCSAPVTKSSEGEGQQVVGTATDNAGNSATNTAVVSIDKTPPTIQASVDRPANAAGWYDDDVVVTFACSDALSGIAVCSAKKTLGEGAGQSASGTAKDKAGNTATDSVSGINVDKTAPSLSGAATAGPNANGWYSDDVTIHWTCSDALSGIAAGACPADAVIVGEGDDLGASASVSDRAGNSTNASVGGIMIDRHAPSTSAASPAPLASGWYAKPVPVTLTAIDELSGVASTHYAIDGAAAQSYTGPFSVSGGGAHTVTFWSEDKAGNVEDNTAAQNSITFRIDNVKPTITGSRNPAANGFGWNNGPVVVSFKCEDAESGIAGCSAPVELTSEGGGQFATGNAADNAGNTAETTVSGINIDLTPPLLYGQRPDPTGTDEADADWYRADVTIAWVCQDGLSGIDGSCPASSVVTGEGRNLAAGPVSVSDKAGNSTSASLDGLNIDRKGPTIKGGATTSPNGAGWYSGLVKVGFNCTDPALADGSAGSGVAACPSDVDLTDEGANQSVTSAPAKDYAGNSTAGKQIGGINIDNTAPSSVDTVSCTLQDGFCNGSSPVSMTITGSDPVPPGVVGVSGVKEIRYSKDGGATWTTASGSSVTVPITLSSSGTATVTYYAVDRAGNAEAQHADSINYDGTAPKVTHTLVPAANAADWSNADTLVHFDAQDDPGGSGVEAASVTADATYSAETADQLITGSADDVAGNHGTDSFHFHLDKTAPALAATVTPKDPDGNNGWYVSPVNVTFNCSDPAAANGAAGSGVAVCPDPYAFSTNGRNQSITRSVLDKADNSTSKTVGPFSVDMEQPTVTIGGVRDGGVYVLGNVPTPTCNATDSFSGVATCRGTLSGGLPNGVGTFTYAATATDKAGNASDSVSVTYKVIYNVPASSAFFLQPINDTAHTVSTTVSVFKAGQTVPVKFQLKNAAGQVVQANALPSWQTPSQGNLTTSPVNEGSFTATGDSGSSFRWDALAQQYIYNWNTSSTQTGYYWKIGVRLDDGMTYYTEVGLRR